MNMSDEITKLEKALKSPAGKIAALGATIGGTGLSMSILTALWAANGEKAGTTWNPGTDFGNFNITAICLLVGGFAILALALRKLDQQHEAEGNNPPEPTSNFSPTPTTSS